MNQLYLGDCFNILHDCIKDETVDLIYIDPPFDSKRNYNIFFDDKEIHTQRVAFEDTWSYKSVGDSLLELQTAKTEKLYSLLKVYREIDPQVFPYLVMMTLRILELHRVLKTTGSFYLHCDPTASHYLKTICDAIFGANQFRNEIIWRRHYSHNDGNKFGCIHDVILFYTKSTQYVYNRQFIAYDEDYIKKNYALIDEKTGKRYRSVSMNAQGQGEPKYFGENLLSPPKGTHWRWSQERIDNALKEEIIYFTKNGVPRYKQFLENIEGVTVQDTWIDFYSLSSHDKERLGYPTQKPRALLERIVKTSSNENDVILDAFCGCGTTLDVAEYLKRQWIGIDISPIALSLMKYRLQDTYTTHLSKFTIRGVPEDKGSAVKLWEENPFVFQDWWIMEFEVFSSTFGKKGADSGIDGLGMYLIPTIEEPIKAAFQVKGGKVQSKDIDALLGAMVKHKCELGVFLTVQPPTKPMLETVANSGYYSAAGFNYPRLQILTLEEFFSGKALHLPKVNITFKSAQTAAKSINQGGLEF